MPLNTDPNLQSARQLLRGPARDPPRPDRGAEPCAQRAPGAAAGQPHRPARRAAQACWPLPAPVALTVQGTHAMTELLLPIRLRQPVRQRGRARRAAGGPQQPAARPARAVCRAAVGQRLHRAAHEQPRTWIYRRQPAWWWPAAYEPYAARRTWKTGAAAGRGAARPAALAPGGHARDTAAGLHRRPAHHRRQRRPRRADRHGRAPGADATGRWSRAFVNADGETAGGAAAGRADASPPSWACCTCGRARWRCCRAAWPSSVGVDGPTRLYVCENHGAPFRLPELGPIGSNGLANPRDFLAPVAAFERAAAAHRGGAQVRWRVVAHHRARAAPSTWWPGTATWCR
jgi:hypothetical protein